MDVLASFRIIKAVRKQVLWGPVISFSLNLGCPYETSNFGKVMNVKNLQNGLKSTDFKVSSIFKLRGLLILRTSNF